MAIGNNRNISVYDGIVHLSTYILFDLTRLFFLQVTGWEAGKHGAAI